MIYVTGDTHIPIDISKLNTNRFPCQKSMTKDDHLIICGDFGGVWDNSNEELYWRKWLDKKNFTTLFVDGNHENFDLLNSFETVVYHGGKAHKISDSIYHLARGQVYDIDGARFFTFGGASSHDKIYRTEGESWWREELPSQDEFEEACANLKKADWSVDYIITHCAPSSVQQAISQDFKQDILTDFLEEIRQKASFKKWFFGHYHIDQTINEKYRVLYNDTIQVV